MPNEGCRWSDQELEQFHKEFLQHAKHEEEFSQLYRELHEAVFRKSDPVLGTQPGILEHMTQLNQMLLEQQKWQDRQKTFVGGILFTFSCLGFFLTDTAHKLLNLFRSL